MSGTSAHGADCSCARCVGFERGNELATTHGASSERRIRPQARNHRRRILRQLRLRAGDLDPIGRGYLDSYVRLLAKVELIDDYVAEHGLIRADGEVHSVLRLYVALQNSARLSLARLEAHLTERVLIDEPLAVIEAEGRRLRLAAGDDEQ